MTSKVTHILTVTETTSTMPNDDNNKLACNIGALKTKNGLLILLETIVGTVMLGILFRNDEDAKEFGVDYSIGLAFLLSTLSSVFRTFLLLLSYVVSPMAANVIPRTIFEFLHNLVAFLLCAPSSLAYIVIIAKERNGNHEYEAEIACAVLGLVISALYLLSTFYSYTSFKSS